MVHLCGNDYTSCQTHPLSYSIFLKIINELRLLKLEYKGLQKALNKMKIELAKDTEFKSVRSMYVVRR